MQHGDQKEDRTPRRCHVRVSGLPTWVDAARLLGPTPFGYESSEQGTITANAELPAKEAAALDARLRRLRIGGHDLAVQVQPALGRSLVRAARLDEARARRDTTPGFTARGVRLDEEGRYSLTPEALALAIGARAKGLTVLDACAGSGGNAIGFARAGAAAVHAIELDPARAADARHNVSVYGVQARVRVEVGDARAILPTAEADLLFLDPPWGRDYDKHAVTRASLPLLDALLPYAPRFRTTLVKVPMAFDVSSIPGARVEAVFGEAKGDTRRIKFLLLTVGA